MDRQEVIQRLESFFVSEGFCRKKVRKIVDAFLKERDGTFFWDNGTDFLEVDNLLELLYLFRKHLTFPKLKFFNMLENQNLKVSFDDVWELLQLSKFFKKEKEAFRKLASSLIYVDGQALLYCPFEITEKYEVARTNVNLNYARELLENARDWKGRALELSDLKCLWRIDGLVEDLFGNKTEVIFYSVPEVDRSMVIESALTSLSRTKDVEFF